MLETIGMAHQYVLSAIKSKNIVRFMQLVELPGSDVNFSVKGVTPLILAAKSGQSLVTEKLIHKGAELDISDNEGRTALLHACQRGHSGIVRQLLLSGCDTKVCSVNGDDALHEAITSGDVETVTTVLECGADVNRCNNVTSYTPLMLALLNLQNNIARLLMLSGADLDLSVPEGDTALHFAVQVASTDIISDLISAGCPMDRLNNMGETPLVIAVYEGRVDIAKLLILSGCRVDKYDYFSPLCIACLQDNVSMVSYLLSEGYNVSSDTSFQENMFIKFENRHADLLDYIVTERSVQPLSLKEATRVQIRRLMGPNVSSLVGKLSLPVILQQWLSRDIIYFLQ